MRYSIVFLLCWLPGLVLAQLTGKADTFGQELATEVVKLRSDGHNQWLGHYLAFYESDTLSDSERTLIAKTLGLLLREPGYKLVPHGLLLLDMTHLLKDSVLSIRLPLDNYLKVIYVARGGLAAEGQFQRYNDRLAQVLGQGLLYDTQKSRWTVEADSARLVAQKQYDAKRKIEVIEPLLRLDRAFLHYEDAYTRGTLAETNALYHPLRWLWEGQGGTYAWTRAGLDGGAVYCSLRSYRINCAETAWTADSVTLTYAGGPAAKLAGRLVEDFAQGGDPERLQYPQFYSQGERVEIPNILPGVDYVGGFALKGKHRYGSSDDRHAAELRIKRADTLVLRAQLREVSLEDPQINQKFVRASLLLPGGDSLYHPMIDLFFDTGTRQLRLLIDRDSPASWQPIYSSHHRMEFYIDEVSWNLANDTLHFGSAIAQEWKKFALQSQDWFDAQTYMKLNGTQYFNPIGMIYKVYLEDLKRQREAKRASQVRQKQIQQRQAEAEDQLSGFEWNDRSNENTQENPGSLDFADFGSEWNVGSQEDEEIAEEYEQEAQEEQDESYGSVEVLPAKSNPTEVKQAPDAKTQTLEVRPHYDYSVDEVLRRFGHEKSKASFLEQLRILSGAGFVDFNRQTEIITIRPKLIRWGASINHWRDYDKLVLQTYVEGGDNAYLLYPSKEINMRGVELFYLNDSVLVSAYPESYKVSVYENRTLDWAGGVKAGKANLEAKGHSAFRYSYADNKIDCDSIDYIRFVPERDKFYQPDQLSSRVLRALKRLRIEDITGAIYITQPNNKSAYKPHGMYPVFDSHTEAFVYWDEEDVQARQYSRDKLHFILDPFVIDSLETCDLRGLEFLGEFECAEIFEPFRDTLKPVADDTYGVHQLTPPAGWQAYQGKGRFYNELTMDSYGLWGNGKIEYLACQAESDTFTFHFDSVMAKTRNLRLQDGAHGGASYPDISVAHCKYTWYPKAERLVLESAYKEPFVFYNGTAEFLGRIVITPRGAYGDGVLTMGDMQLESDSIDMSDSKLTAAAGTLRVADPKLPTRLYFQAENSVLEYDVKEGQANFYSREPGVANNSFPGLQYRTSLGKGHYNHKTAEISLASNTTNPQLNFFESTNPAMRGLRFEGQVALFDTLNQRLEIKEADSIHVADAILYPDSAQVTILPSGKMNTLNNARIVFDDSTRYHQLYSAVADIQDAYNYKAKARYLYANVLGQPQEIYFNTIKVLGDSLSVGYGEILEADKFYLSEKILFRNTATITANQRFLAFEGEVKVEFDNPTFDEWIAFKDGFVNPDTVIVKIDAQKLRGKSVGMSYYASLRNRYFYQLFLEQKSASQAKDRDILTAYGALTYDKSVGKFRIGPTDKLLGKSFLGNVMETDDRLEVKTARGLMAWPVPDNPLANTLKMRVAGAMTQHGDPEKMDGQVSITLDFPKDLRSAFYKYGSRMVRDGFNQFPADLSARHTQEYLSELMVAGKETEKPDELPSQVWLEQAPKLDDLAQLKLGQYMENDLVISGLKLRYCPAANAFYTAEDANLLAMAGETLNKQVSARAAYVFGRPDARGNQRADTLFLYIGWANDFEYLYLEVTDGYIKAVSSHIGTTQVLEEQLLKMQKKPDDYPYQLVIGKEDDKTLFFNRFSLKYSPSACERSSAYEQGAEDESPETQPDETPDADSPAR